MRTHIHTHTDIHTFLHTHRHINDISHIQPAISHISHPDSLYEVKGFGYQHLHRSSPVLPSNVCYHMLTSGSFSHILILFRSLSERNLVTGKSNRLARLLARYTLANSWNDYPIINETRQIHWHQHKQIC